jgi:site-specific DNA-methyltransferase (adenine-specific)
MAETNAENYQELVAELHAQDAEMEAWLDLQRKNTPKTGLTSPDDIPEILVDPGVKTGDLFALGDHRLLCGDSTKPKDVARLMDGAIADIIWTDPPYGVGYQSTEKLLTGDKYASHRRKDGKTLSNDDLTAEQTRQLVTESLRLAPLKPGGVFYVCSPSGDLELQFRLALIDAGMPLRQQVVWAKDRFVFGRQDYQWRHETVLYGWKDGAAHYFIDDRTQDTVWEIPRPARSEEHPTMKPVELVVRSLNNSSLPGQVVYEPFDGSGTTIIASEQLGRRCYAIEIDPKYVSVAIERWQNFSGGKAVNLATGEPWAGGGDLLARLEKGT